MNAWRLLLTRPAEDCVALAAHLAEHGVYGACLPVLAIEPLAQTLQQEAIISNLQRYCAVIVVSKPAARIGLDLLDQFWPQPLLDQPWFSVGAATGALLEDYGLCVHYPAVGDDSEALLSLPELQQAIAGDAVPRVLIVRAEDGRELLADSLRSLGVGVDYLPLYRRVLPVYPLNTLYETVKRERLNALVVSSGQGLQHLLQLAGAHWPELSQLPLFVPSARVAALARERGAKHVVDCCGASPAALLAALESHSAVTL